MVTRRKTPKFYFSLRSPYSWLAYRDLRHHHPDLALPGRMEWLPYYEPDAHSERLLRQIGGELPYAEMNRAKHMYILQDVGRLAEARGIELSWPVDREPVWEIPHLGFLVAHREGRGLEYVDAVYRARWEEGRDICRRETIAEIGEALGLDADEVGAAGDNQELRARGAEILLRSCRDGVFGVPFFMHGFTRFWGVDRLAAFAAHLRAQAPADVPPPEPVPAAVGLGRSPDDGHAGGCG